MHSLHATKKLARLLGRQIGHDSCTKLVSLKLRSHYLLDSWIFRKLSFSSSSFLLACLIASYRVYLLTYLRRNLLNEHSALPKSRDRIMICQHLRS